MITESAAFENFKFKIGDTVSHVVGSAHGLVKERWLIQTTAGVYRVYSIAFLEREIVAEEIELEQQPRRS